MFLFGMISATVMYLASPALSKASGGGDDLVPAMRSLSVAILVIPVMSVLRGYFQGTQNVGPFAISQLVEQFFRVIYMLMATFIVSLMTLFDETQFLAWGWRIPFLLSSVLVFLGLWIRKDIDETPAFKQVKKSGQVAKAPLRDTLKHHWREVLIAAGLKVVETAPFYIFSTFVVSYATTTLSYQKSQALESVTLGALVATVMIPLMGLLSDKVGRQKMYTLSVVLLGLFIVPWFLLLDTGTGWGIMLATIVAFGILWAPVTAVLGTLCSEIFSANVRYTGITLGYQLGAALAGGTAPLIATGLLAKYDGDWRPVAIYLGVTVAISLLAIFCASRMKSAPDVARSRAERA